MTKPDDGSAFPLVWEDTNQHGTKFIYVERGMSLRDYFAGQALPALIARYPPGLQWSEVAQIAYQIADAMIAERTKPEANHDGV